jgi:sirohydrochlorin cobaltochelatase
LARIVVFPYFLFNGVLVKRIHRLTADASRTFPEITFSVAAHLADHPAIVETVTNNILTLALRRQPP